MRREESDTCSKLLSTPKTRSFSRYFEKCLSLILFIFIISSCVPGNQLQVEDIAPPPPSPSITAGNVVNDVFIFNGSDLSDVNTVSISDGTTTYNLTITSQTASSIQAVAQQAINFIGTTAYNIIISSAQGQATFPITVTPADGSVGLSQLADVGAADGDVLKWNDTSGEWYAAADSSGGGGSGDIDAVIAGTGLTGGATSGSATLNVDVGTGANKIPQINGSGLLPLSTGLQLTVSSNTVKLETDGSSKLTITDVTGASEMANIANDGTLTLQGDLVVSGNSATVNGLEVCLSDGTNCPGGGGGGDITGVTAGTGLTGGATSGNATLNVDVGTTANKIPQLDGSGLLATSIIPSGIVATNIGGGTVDNTEFGHLNGVTSAIQTQIDGTITAVTAGTGLTGGATSGTATVNVDVGTGANQIPQLNGSGQLSSSVIPSSIVATKIGGGTVDNTEFAHLNGVTSGIQSQIDGNISAVTAGTGLTGGATSGAATLNVDVGTGNNKIPQINGSGVLPLGVGVQVTSGSNTVKLDTDGASKLTITDVTGASEIANFASNGTLTLQGGLVVTGSSATVDGKDICLDDGTNCPAGSSGDITGVTAGTGLTGGATSGNATLNVDVGTGNNKIPQINGSGVLPLGVGVQVTSGSNTVKLDTDGASKLTITDVTGASEMANIASNGTLTLQGGLVVTGSSATVDGKDICLDDGTNCPAGSSGDITAVVAGTGLTGGATSGSATLNVDVGTTANKIPQLDGSGLLPSSTMPSGIAATNIGGGAVDNTEFGYLDGVTSAIQTQIDGTITAVTAGTGLTGGATSGTATVNVDVGTTANKIPQLDGSGLLATSIIPSGIVATNIGGGAVDNTEFGYLDGVTSAIQTQIDGNISAVTAGTGLTGGATSGAATLNVDVGTGNNKIPQINGSGVLPLGVGVQVTSGSNTVKLDTDGTSKLTIRDVTGASEMANIASNGTLTLQGGLVVTGSTATVNGKDVCLDDGTNCPAGATGDITAVVAGTGLTGGATSGSATLNVDVGTTANKIPQLDGSGLLPSSTMPSGIAATNIGAGSVDNTEFGYLNGVTSAIQTQIDGTISAVTAGTGLTGGATSGNATVNVDVGTGANQIPQLDGSGDLDNDTIPSNILATKIGGGTVDNTEFSFLNGVTSGIQAQISGNISAVIAGTGLLGGAASGDATLNVNAGNGANQIPQLDGSGLLAASTIPSGIAATKIGGGDVDNTEFGYLDGLTSSIQSQISGSITEVTAGTGLTGGATSGSATLNVDVGTTANKIPQLDGSGLLATSIIPSGIVATNIGGGTVDNTEFGHLNGVTSAIQTQIDGTITAVTAGTGLTGGATSGTATVNVDVGTGNNKIPQINGSGVLPLGVGVQVTSGSNTVKLDTDGSSKLTITDVTGASEMANIASNGTLTLQGGLVVTGSSATVNGKDVCLDDGTNCPAGATGDITAVVAGTGLTGGATSGSATLNVDVGTTANKIPQLDGSGDLNNSTIPSGIVATKIGAGSVDNTELGYLNGVTSAIQTQLDGMITAVTAGTGLTGGATSGTATVNVDVGTGANQIPQLDGSGDLNNSTIPSGIVATKIGGGTVDNTEFGHLNGVTSAIQTQMDGKLDESGGTLTGSLVVPDVQLTDTGSDGNKWTITEESDNDFTISDGSNEKLRINNSGDVGIGVTPTVRFEVKCPSGFTNVKDGDNQLGCIQNTEEGTNDFFDANHDCFTTYGGRLPTLSEWYISMRNYSLTDETDDYEIVNPPKDDNNVYRIGHGGLQVINDDGSLWSNYRYRCWIPR